MLVTFVSSRNWAENGGGLTGMGCGRRCPLAGDVGGRHRLLLDVEKGLAGHAVEQEDVAGLRHLRDGVNRLAVVGDRDQVRIDRQVVVPQVMMERLEVPDALFRPGVERDGAVGEEIVALPVASVEVEGGRAQSREDQSAFRVDAEPTPGVRRASDFTGIVVPRLVSEFSPTGHGPKSPNLRAGADVKRPDISGRGDAGPLITGDSDNDRILPDGRRRRRSIA